MNVYTMPGVTDLVWMGASQITPDMGVGLIHSDSSEMMLDHDSPFFTGSHHSTSNHSLEDMQVHHSPMEMEALGLLDYDDMKQDSNDTFNDSSEESSTPRFMMSTATQTAQIPSRKIKPIKHPGLVLKTPIAYQRDTDLSVIPIQKDGMAVCEKCGAIGVKHAFYTRERRFCSMACARGYNGLNPEPLTLTQDNVDITTSIATTTTLTSSSSSTFTTTVTNANSKQKQYGEYKFKMEIEDELSSSVCDEPIPQIVPPPVLAEEVLPHPRRKNAELANTHDWDPQLGERTFFAAPVSCFRHAPITEMWDNILVGMKVEVENTDCDDFSETFHDSFWVATVLKITGYKALMRYEGFGTNGSKDFWVSLCSAQVHPVGWCATRGKPLIPPKTIEDKYNDWKEFLVKRLTGARTLPSNFSNKISDGLKCRFQCGLNLEVVDKNRISQVKVAMVHKIIGKRLHVRYYDSTPDDNGFWCHEDSPLIHPVGWAKKVGHTLDAPLDYLERINEGIWDEDDATDDLFLASQTGTNDNNIRNGFCEGMKLEAIDPLNLSSICVATVMDVLRFGYIMIRIDSYDADATGADWFCYHISSPCIFPAGFCASNSIPLTPPKGYDSATFQWDTYLRDTNNIAASMHLFNRDMPNHGFVAGMKMEAADLMDPRLVCVATVAKVVGRLLKIRFDGWEEEYDQWLDCESPDIYPVGWCQLVGHKLEGPRVIPKQPAPIVKSPKTLKKRGRKKKNQVAATVKEKQLLAIKQEKEQHHHDTTFASKTDAALPHIKQEIDIVEPEMGQEPSGPDQSMPIAAEPTPPLERKATSYINSTTTTSTKVIPRLVDSSGGNCEPGELCPSEWNVFDVAQFLRVNDCANYCDTFSKQKIDGKTLLTLTKDEIINFTGMKVGPSLKIFDLIQQLKIKVNPAQSRLMKANIKKIL